jgi:hypothetical protein
MHGEWLERVLPSAQQVTDEQQDQQ